MDRRPEYSQAADMAVRGAVKTIVPIVVLLLLFALAVTSYTIVKPGNIGVSVVLGKVSKTPLSSGLHLQLPFGIERIVEVQSWEQTETSQLEAFSSDMQSIKIKCSVMFSITPAKVPELFEKYSGTQAKDWYLKQVEPRLQEIVKQVTATHRAQDLAQKRVESKQEILGRIQKAVTTLDIKDFTIDNIDLDPKLKDSIEQKMIADQKAQAKQYELAEALKQAEITKVEADAKAQALRVTGDAVAASPQIALIEAIKKWDGKLPTTMVVNAGGAGTSGTPVILPLK